MRVLGGGGVSAKLETTGYIVTTVKKKRTQASVQLTFSSDSPGSEVGEPCHIPWGKTCHTPPAGLLT